MAWIRVVCCKCKQGFQMFADSKTENLQEWTCKKCRDIA